LNQIQIFITQVGATILIFHGMLMLRKIMLPKLTNRTILIIHSSTTNFLDYPQFDNQFSSHSSYDYPSKQSSLEEILKEFMELVGQPTILASHELSLEDTLKAFRKTINQPCQEIIDATVVNTEAVARLERQFGHLVAEFNRIEEEEFQSQEMARGQYMIDKDCPNDPHHEHVQATTTFESEEVVEEIFCEPSLEDPLEERFDHLEMT
jgi:exonuclease VII small subunit